MLSILYKLSSIIPQDINRLYSASWKMNDMYVDSIAYIKYFNIFVIKLMTTISYRIIENPYNRDNPFRKSSKIYENS